MAFNIISLATSNLALGVEDILPPPLSKMTDPITFYQREEITERRLQMTSVVPRDAPHTPTVRGDAVMKQQGNIVKTYRLGKTIVHVCSDHFAKTEEEKKKVIREMHLAGWAIWNGILNKKSEEK